MSRARATPTNRGNSHAAPVSGVKPKLVNGSQRRASSATTAKSDASAMLSPSPTAHPRTTETTGVCVSSNVGIRRLTCHRMRRWIDPTRGRSTSSERATGSRRQIEARAEVLAGTGEDDDPDALVASRRLDRVRERGDDLVGQRVASLRPVETSGQDTITVLDDEARPARRDTASPADVRQHDGHLRVTPHRAGVQTDGSIVVDVPRGKPSKRLLDRDPSLEPGQCRPDAEMDAVAERHVIAHLAMDVELIGRRELPLVAACRSGQEQHFGIGGDGRAVQLEFSSSSIDPVRVTAPRTAATPRSHWG